MHGFVQMKFKVIDNCLACESQDLLKVLDLGSQPLANSYRDVDDDSIEEIFPLLLRVCQQCFHAQISVAVDPLILYEEYSYVSGTTSTLRSYFKEFAEEISQRGKKTTVLDIAANDGSFVRALVDVGLKACGVDPAKNLVKKALSDGLPMYFGFWSSRFAHEFNQRFDVITAMNVLAHVGDPLDFLIGCRMALKPSGSIFIQTSQAFMINRGEFDTIYHEHHSFFNTRSLQRLAERANLHVVDGKYVDVHGTSYRWELKDKPSFIPLDLLDDESRRGMTTMETFFRFAEIAEDRARETASIINRQRGMGFTICAYGAAAKAHTFFNYANIKPDVVVDDNPLKQGCRSPGSGVIIQHPDSLREIEGPVQFIISAWNFAKEIKGHIVRIRPNQTDDRFLQYFPEVENSGH